MLTRMSVSPPRTAFGWAFLALLAACEPRAVGEQSPPLAPVAKAPSSIPAPPAASDTADFAGMPRLDFNRLAVEHNLPFFWRSDSNADGALQPNELAITWSHTAHTRAEFVDEHGRFTPAFSALYEQMAKPDSVNGLSSQELERRAMVRLELAQGRTTLVESDFSKQPEPEKKLVAHLLRVAVSIEQIYAKQKGSAGLEAKLDPTDPASAALFFRNQGPECAAPKTERDPHCHALPLPEKPPSGLYPAELQNDPKFCELLGKQKNQAELLDHFSVVVKGGSAGTFKAVPYPQAYPSEMAAVAAELDAAAADLGAEEPALKAYLSAASQSFRDNDWERANRAWVQMGTDNSKYYLRVGPDKPYQARSVGFELPDFIDVVLNAGDNRSPIGATVGQSLPNWGPVAETGGRTVTMTNLYTDEDSQRALLEKMSSLYCASSMKLADPKPSLMGVVLHEAAHNLGPAHDYKVNGKVDTAIFGGPLAATLEELKAQTAALYLPATLVDRHLITQLQADTSHLQEVAWTFGQIAQGMYDPQGKPRNYSQLAAIQLSSLTSGGAVEWKATELAANRSDRGCYEVHLDKWNASVSTLAKQVLQIKGRGDKFAAEALKKRAVDDQGDFKAQRALIADRWLRSPKSSFVYSISGL